MHRKWKWEQKSGDRIGGLKKKKWNNLREVTSHWHEIHCDHVKMQYNNFLGHCMTDWPWRRNKKNQCDGRASLKSQFWHMLKVRLYLASLQFYSLFKVTLLLKKKKEWIIFTENSTRCNNKQWGTFLSDIKSKVYKSQCFKLWVEFSFKRTWIKAFLIPALIYNIVRCSVKANS